MAMIDHDTTIYFCSDVPLDNRYTNTLFFENRGLQNVYFQRKIKAQMSGCSYQRYRRAIRCALPISDLWECNYIFFENPEFENKRFYAFITDIAYINNGLTELTFEIDIMQTFFLDCVVRQCFIQRAHSSIDEIGDNLIPENIETGEYVNVDTKYASALTPMAIGVACTVDENGEDAVGGYYSGVYSGVKILTFREADAVNDFLKSLTENNKADSVVSIFMIPYTLTESTQTVPKVNDFNITKPYSTIDGYTPKNKKLFTYPYNVLHITNGEGMSANYYYEFFSTNPCHFAVIGSMTTSPEVICVPDDYKGTQRNYGEKLTLDGWPQCAWNIDTYKAWVAQNANVMAWQDNTAEMRLSQRKVSGAINFGQSILSTVGAIADSAASAGFLKMGGLGNATLGRSAGGMAENILGSLGSLAKTGYGEYTSLQNVENDIAGILAAREDHATTPPQAKGGGSSTVMQGLGLKTFWIYQKQIQAKFARIIDDYFTMFGYAQHIVATPNVDARTRFTYIQTKGSNVYGNAPVWAISGINKIFDNGITFWHDYQGVGNFTYDNPPKGNGEY